MITPGVVDVTAVLCAPAIVRAMRRGLWVLVGVLLVGAGAGVGVLLTRGGEQSVSVAVRSASPARSVDLDREACHSFSTNYDPDDVGSQFEPGGWVLVAQTGQHATDAGIKQAADALFDVALANQRMPEGQRAGRPNLDLQGAQLDLAEACGTRFGNGPW